MIIRNAQGQFISSSILNKETEKEICSKYLKEEMSLPKISDLFNLPMSLVYSTLKQKGTNMRPKGFQDGHNQFNFGRTRFKKGQHPWNHGKKIIKMIGNSNGFKKGQVPWNKDSKGLMNSHRKNVSIEKEYGLENANEIKRKIKQARAKQVFPIKDTKIEVKIQNFLDELKIEYFAHKYLNIQHAYQCDIFIPSKNMVIECDGTYWHKYPVGREIDHVRTSELIEKGFKVLRLWEFEINQMSIDEFRSRLI